KGEMERFFDLYLAGRTRPDDPRAAPLGADLADLAGLPPAYLLACGLDVLRDDSLTMAAALAEAGVRFRLDMLPGATHGFLRYGSTVPLAERALAEAGAFLRSV